MNKPVEIPEPGRDPMAHAAGEVVTLFGRYMRQRCSWCGTVLVEYDLARVAAPVGQEGAPSGWPVGSQVYVDGNMGYVVETEVAEDGSVKIVDDSCMANPLTLLSFG